MKMSKKGGIGRVIVWIVIILIILGVLFVAYNYMSQNSDSNIDTGQTGGEVTNGESEQQQQITGGEGEQLTEEKPPRPPE